MRSFTPIERTFISLSEYRESKVFRAKAIIETSNPHVKSVRYYFNEFFLSSESQINENRERTIPTIFNRREEEPFLPWTRNEDSFSR